LQQGALHARQIAREPKTFVLILETGDEILSSIQSFAQERGLSGSSFKGLSGSSFKAIGALSEVKLGWFNW